MDWRWAAAACVQRAGRGHIVSPRAQHVDQQTLVKTYPVYTAGMTHLT